MSSSWVNIEISGRLLAVGTQASPITFTSAQASPAAGNWNKIRFVTGTNPASQLVYATVTYGGYSNDGGIKVESGSPSFDHVTVSTTSGRGVHVTGGSVSLTNSMITQGTSNGLWVTAGATVTSLEGTTISNNTGYGVYVTPGAVLPVLTGLTMSGNGGGTKNAVGYYGGTISGNETWHAGAPWVVEGTVGVASGVTLTIDPGVVVKMASSGVNIEISGRLLAVGTQVSPITFTSAQAGPAAGNWNKIRFVTGTNPASQLAYATVSYGGYSNDGAIKVSRCPSFDHVTVSTTSGRGVYVTGGSVSLTNSTITQGTSNGLWVTAGASVTSLEGTTISNNTGYGVYVTPGATLPVMTGLTMSGNGGGTKDGVGYYGNTMSSSETWHVGAPWIMERSVTVASGATLTLDPGVTVKFGSNLDMWVNGRLVAVGTQASPITFTSAQASPAAGNWNKIKFATGANPASQLAYATVMYGGYSNDGAIKVESDPQASTT